MGLCEGEKMNFSPAAKDLSKQAQKVVDYILSLNISPTEKRRRLVKAFGIIGNEFFDKMFRDNSTLFGSEAIRSTGFENPEDQIERLSSKLVQNYNLGRENKEIVTGFFDSVLADAQHEAFENGKSMGRVPTLTRSLVGETCGWCRARVGTFTYPDGELFARHDNCDCLFIVKGYNSRNGILTNYRKARS